MIRKILVFVLAGIIVTIDLVTKNMVLQNIKLNDTINMVDGFFNLTYVRNTGAAFGSMANSTMLLVVFSIIALIILLVLVITDKKITKTAVVGMGFIIGGIVGNLFDRVIRGYVVDFFDFTIFNYDFPVFNVADIFIVLGVFFLIFTIIWGDSSEKDKRTQKQLEA